MAQTPCHSRTFRPPCPGLNTLCPVFIFLIVAQFDFACGGPVIEATKQIMGPDCKTLLWFCCAAVSMIAHFNEYDHDATTQKIYADETRRGGRTMDEILQQVRLRNKEDLHYLG